MERIAETLSTPVTHECDVLVAGGGVAGIAAALSAARQGSRVILLEKQFMLGGLATAGLVTIYLPLCDGKGHQISFGIAEELLRLSVQYGYEKDYPTAWLEGGSLEEKTQQRFQVRYNAQLFAMTAEQLLLKEGVTILYGTSACSVAMADKVDVANDKITAVIVENKSGRTAIKVKSVIDATGDADICAMAGVETALFGPGNILAAWHYCENGRGYDLCMLGYAEIPEEDRTEETKTLIARRFRGVDGQELSEMMQLTHERILEEVVRKKQENPAYMPVTIATIPQIRMTRRIVGGYTMETSDERKDFEDSVGMISNWKKRGPVYEVPYRALYSAKVKNLITAGRNISAGDAMWDVTRVIPACAVTGEAAGVAASMTDDFAALDTARLQEKLMDCGVKLFYSQL
ncbi:MAG: FAD-dependent oxidoreductase [Lachnospiraceae bacterium]|nr:FAD-dependent oxidoreductase [Lachnospiraceae bacterium]